MDIHPYNFFEEIDSFDETEYSLIRQEYQLYYQRYSSRRSLYFKTLMYELGLDLKQYSYDVDFNKFNSNINIKNILYKCGMNVIIFTDNERQAYYDLLF